jgi:hypothetical protein
MFLVCMCPLNRYLPFLRLQLEQSRTTAQHRAVTDPAASWAGLEERMLVSHDSDRLRSWSLGPDH